MDEREKLKQKHDYCPFIWSAGLATADQTKLGQTRRASYPGIHTVSQAASQPNKQSCISVVINPSSHPCGQLLTYCYCCERITTIMAVSNVAKTKERERARLFILSTIL